MAKRRPTNSGGPTNSMNRLSELAEKFERQLEQPGAEEYDILTSIGEEIQKRDVLTSQPNARAQDIGAAHGRIETLHSRLTGVEERRMNTAVKQYSGGVATALRGSNLQRDVNAMAGTSGIMGSALSQVGTPTYQLEQQQQNAMKAMLGVGGSIVEMAQNEPNNVKGVQGLAAQMQGHMGQAATTQAALDLQRKQGLDIKSRYLGSMERQERFENMLGSGDLSRDVAAGKVGTRSSVINDFRSSVGEIGRLRSEQSGTTDPKKFEDLQKAIDGLTASASGAAKTLAEIDRQGGGGGGWGGAATKLGYAASGAGAIGSITTAALIDLPRRELANEIRYAGIGNKQYDDSVAAMRGDVGALRRIGGSYGAASDINASMKWRSRVASTATAAGGVLGGAASVAGGLAKNEIIPGSGIGDMVGGVGNIANSAVSGAVNFNQQAGEIGSTTAMLKMQQLDAMSHIADTTTQSYVDFTKNLAMSTRGAGSGRGELYGGINNSANLAVMADLGISPADAAKLASQGVSDVGKGFGASDIMRAGQMQQTGYMNAGQYIGAMGSLSMVGGNAGGNMEEILKNAVANGMDNSKNIMQMVSATASLAQRSASMGIDTATGSAQALGKMTDYFKDLGVPENMRAGAAMSAAAGTNAAITDQSLNFANVGEQGRLSRMFGGLQLPQRQRLSNLSVQDVNQMMQPGGAGLGAIEKFGLGEELTKVDAKGNRTVNQEKLEELRKDKVLKLLESTMAPGQSPALDSARKKIQSGEELSYAEQQAVRAQSTGAAGFDILGGAAGLGGKSARAGAVKVGAGGEVGAAEGMIATAAGGEAKQLEAGRNVVEALGGLQDFADTLKEVLANFKPEEMSKGVKEAAESFSVPVHDFGTHVKAFGEVIQNLDSKKK